MRGFERVRPTSYAVDHAHAPFGAALAARSLRLGCLSLGAFVLASCAAIPASHQTSAAERAIDRELARRFPDPARAAERVYHLTLASALLEKSREQAAKGRFQSAAQLAEEAARLASIAGGSGGGA